jgi:hypothetical protein
LAHRFLQCLRQQAVKQRSHTARQKKRKHVTGPHASRAGQISVRRGPEPPRKTERNSQAPASCVSGLNPDLKRTTPLKSYEAPDPAVLSRSEGALADGRAIISISWRKPPPRTPNHNRTEETTRRLGLRRSVLRPPHTTARTTPGGAGGGSRLPTQTLSRGQRPRGHGRRAASPGSRVGPTLGAYNPESRHRPWAIGAAVCAPPQGRLFRVRPLPPEHPPRAVLSALHSRRTSRRRRPATSQFAMVQSESSSYPPPLFMPAPLPYAAPMCAA